MPFQPDEPLCAAAAIAAIELTDHLHDADPSTVALFTLDDGSPFADSQLDHLLKIILNEALPPATAKLYSWHSARIFLATVLAESGASARQIQALCRWQTDEALKIYIRLNSRKCKTLLDGAMAARVTTARTNQLQDALPFLDLHDVLRATARQNTPPRDLPIDDDVHPDDDADDDDGPDVSPRIPLAAESDTAQWVDLGPDDRVRVLATDPAGIAGLSVNIPDRAWPEYGSSPAHQMTTCTIVGATARNPQQYAVDADDELYIFERRDLLRFLGSSGCALLPKPRRRAAAYSYDTLAPACLLRRTHACRVPLQTKARGNADPALRPGMPLRTKACPPRASSDESTWRCGPVPLPTKARGVPGLFRRKPGR